MKTNFLILLFLAMYNVLSAQLEEDQIKITLNKYIEGTSYNNPEMVMEAFYEKANLFLSHKEKKLWIMPIKEYAAGLKSREKGKFNGRTGSILSVDIENDIATAKAEILIPKGELRFIDIFLLKKIEGKWKIISKAATRTN
ncbi:nuclear transport factor 2 family protein [Aquimarina sp. MMG016]|uniref:nuclear transport factor 2 family protein n=1 Tax=Aquimarina sp. MMG016 TaxID=2822690 RepID=UPI001B3A6026|nr:nuclear transport factor 2 family protein [Aquimarina sp. MMG016]MBQ4822064.1 nuclear transport factor 2 family protein [Aquimarina sp. MMG016]